jgi:hypothetical protein
LKTIVAAAEITTQALVPETASFKPEHSGTANQNVRYVFQSATRDTVPEYISAFSSKPVRRWHFLPLKGSFSQAKAAT